jgi:hypothetical protein
VATLIAGDSLRWLHYVLLPTFAGAYFDTLAGTEVSRFLG